MNSRFFLHPKAPIMSTSLLYHGFGISGYLHRRSEYEGGEIHFTIEQPAHRLRCAACEFSKFCPGFSLNSVLPRG